MAEITLTKDNFEEQVLRADRPVLVEFWATWCGPCRMLAPIVAEIAEERGDVTVGKVNVDDESELAARYGVSSIPTVILFKNGKVSATSVGYRSKAQLLAALGI